MCMRLALVRRAPPPRGVAAPVDPNSLWMQALDLQPGQVSQETRRYGEDGLPVRCVVAARRIARGERICVVPPSLVLTGQSADRHLRHFIRLASQQGDGGGPAMPPLRSYEEFADAVRALPAASPNLLASRDALLVTALLYLCHGPSYAGAVPRSPLSAWVRTMPRRAPPLGLLLAGSLERGARPAPLTRRLTLGGMSAPLPLGADAAAAATDLIVASVEEKGLVAGLGTPRTEVVLTDGMLANFYAGKHSALTARQFEAAAAHTRLHHGSAAVRRLAALESNLQREVLLPLLAALSPALAAAAGDEAASTEVEAMRWAHFMARSRALNLRFRSGQAQLAVVPFLDRLNHIHDGANVTYSCRQEEGAGESGGESVVVTASRAITAGEELLLHYGNIGQRGCLFGDERAPNAARAGPQTADARRRMKGEEVTRGVRAIEARQQRDVTYDNEDAAAEAAPVVFSTSPRDTPSESEFSARGNGKGRSDAVRDASREATWLWRFGFMRAEAERSLEASRLWSKGLRDRLAHLTDVRRKGAPGAFVVGVPEGLEHLRAQRESLERERYGSTRVFPPQQS